MNVFPQTFNRFFFYKHNIYPFEYKISITYNFTTELVFKSTHNL